MNLMTESSSPGINIGVPVIAGVGVGMSLQPPLIIIQSAMSLEDMYGSYFSVPPS
jgi:hypothetical protein